MIRQLDILVNLRCKRIHVWVAGFQLSSKILLVTVCILKKKVLPLQTHRIVSKNIGLFLNETG